MKNDFLKCESAKFSVEEYCIALGLAFSNIGQNFQYFRQICMKITIFSNFQIFTIVTFFSVKILRSLHLIPKTSIQSGDMAVILNGRVNLLHKKLHK